MSAATTTTAQSSDATLRAIWNLLQPAVPDCLKELQPGVYEARWWTPAPLDEIALLKQSPKLTLLDAPYEPPNLPGGIAVRFCVR